MKVIQVCWILAACICLSEARYKMRRPLTPPSQPGPQIYKKSWPMAHRMSMGNTIHIGGNHGHKRPLYKPSNYRVRRPPMYNVLPTAWKNQIPVLGVINTHGVLPQRPPVKEFHSMNKVPEYSPEYRPETVVMPPTHRGGMDDDKGAIHTIPAPNLSLADKPYSLVEGNPSENNHEDQSSHHQYSNDGRYSPNHSGTLGTNYGFGTLVTSPAPQRAVTNPVSTKSQYEVTETNEIGSRDYHTVQPTFFTPEFDVTRLATSPNVDLQTNELYVNHGGVINPIKPGLVNGNIQFGNSNTPMQTNLHSSLHVGFPGSAAQAPSSLGQQIPDLHVGHPAPAGPPLSATQLYDLLNSFPQQLNEQYANGQQPQQLQQQILQQQLGQLFQPTGGVTSFSQPQMHSFNYDEQANKRQQQQQQLQLQQEQEEQQQILIDQGYGSGRVTADYTLEPETAGSVSIPTSQGNNLNGEQVVFRGAEPSDQADNHIEYEESNNQRGQNTYFNKVSNDASISTQFFTTLPNKEAAEKLAALAAAGNVNSHLIGQLRKQQQQQQKFEQEQEIQSDQPLPSNHKGSEYQVNEFQEEDPAYESQQQYTDEQQEQFDQQQQIYDEQQNQYEQQIYNRQNFRQQQQTRHRQELNDRYEQQRLAHLQHEDESNEEENSEDDKKRPMRIMVPDVEEYTEENRQRTSAGPENTSEDYDYENSDSDMSDTRTTSVPSSVRTTFEDNPNSEFGTRLSAKKGH